MRPYGGLLLWILCLISACGGDEASPTGDAGTGGAGASTGGAESGSGGARAGGASASGGTAGTGGASASGGTAGTASGGASASGGTAGTASGGASASGGTAGTASGGASASGGTAGTASGGASASGGTVGSGGSGGTPSNGESFVDPAGDASKPEDDLLSGAIYRDGDFLEFRLRFAGTPLTDGGSVSFGSASWMLQVSRDGAGLSVKLQAGGLWLGLDACTHVLIDDETHRLVIRVPSAALSSVSGSVSVGSSGDSVSAFPWRPLAYPGALSSASPACAPWSTGRTSTLGFRDISLGNDFGCGVTLAGEAICWGEPAALSTLGPAPSGPFERISVSVHSSWDPDVYACGLRSTGEIRCWGGSPPTVTGKYRSMGDPFGCAILDNGDLACIDMGAGGIRNATGPISEVAGAGTEECHLTEAGKISCLTDGAAPAGSDFIGLAFGSDTRACGLHRGGRLDCDLATEIPYRLASIDAGSQPYGSFAVGCGLTDTGSPICWGDAGVVPLVHPGPFVRLEVSSTTEGVCGFRADSTLVCWHYSHVAGNPVPATSPP